MKNIHNAHYFCFDKLHVLSSQKYIETSLFWRMINRLHLKNYTSNLPKIKQNEESNYRGYNK